MSGFIAHHLPRVLCLSSSSLPSLTSLHITYHYFFPGIPTAWCKGGGVGQAGGQTVQLSFNSSRKLIQPKMKSVGNTQGEKVSLWSWSTSWPIFLADGRRSHWSVMGREAGELDQMAKRAQMASTGLKCLNHSQFFIDVRFLNLSQSPQCLLPVERNK